MPTGVAIRDARDQLFGAAERVLLRDGPNALTSRAVTSEAGCAKGVLHRHFADFDAFLAELVADRIARLDSQAAALRTSAGTGTVAGHLTQALTDLFGSVALGIVSLVISRDELRARLRRAAGRYPAADGSHGHDRLLPRPSSTTSAVSPRMLTLTRSRPPWSGPRTCSSPAGKVSRPAPGPSAGS